MQVQRSAQDHDAAVTHARHFFIMNIVGEGDGRLVRMGFGFGADFQLPLQHDPFGGQLDIGLIREAEVCAVDVYPASSGGPGEFTSRSTSLPFSMVTLSPARGTFRSGQVAGSDHRVCLLAGVSLHILQLCTVQRMHAAEKDQWKERDNKE